LPEKISAGLAHVGQGERLLSAKGLFERDAPLIRERELKVRRETNGLVRKRRLK